jgi:hypothetical protein
MERTAIPTLRVLSLGAGVQSTTLLLMSCKGELPKLDAAVFADTQGEPAYVYAHFERLAAVAEEAGIPVYLVSDGNLAADLTSDGRRFASIPYYTLSPAGKKGIGRRQCTREYKITPILRKVCELLGAQPRGRVPASLLAEQWIGFSTDEIGRVSYKHRTEHIVQRYPLLERDMSRQDCMAWLERHGWDSVAKSACSFCPYRSNREWRFLRDSHPGDWAEAVAVDEAIRKGGCGGSKTLDGQAFLHPSRVPLPLAVIDDDANQGDPDGCSPYGCRSGVAAAKETT